MSIPIRPEDVCAALEPMLGTQGGREGRVNCCPLATEGSPE